MFLSIILFNSCQTEENNPIEQLVDSEFAKFKIAFPDLVPKININNIQKTNSKNNDRAKSESNISGVTFPVMENDEVIGRYFGLSDESSAIYLDFSNYTDYVKVYDVNDPSSFAVINMVYNKNTGEYEPASQNSFNKSYFWCDLSCTVGALAIAASDGPVPLMDVLAISYQITCMAACREVE